VDRIEGDLSTVYAASSSVTTPVAVLDTGVSPDPRAPAFSQYVRLVR
jgi:hypothetical protein